MLKKLLVIIFKFAVVGGLLTGLFIGFVYLGVFGHIYSRKELQEFKNETASLVLSDDGSLIGKFFYENRTNVDYNQLPLHLVHALVATEDARFFEHEGVDSRSLLRVLVKSIILQQRSAGGGSTITQQLAKNMYGRNSYGFMSMPVNKSKEFILARRLEELYSKEEILTLYLNTVPFGENVFGIEAASGRYFNKSVRDLELHESAVLVGMLKANTYYNPRIYPDNALRRRNVVLQQMEKYGYLSQEEVDRAQGLPLELDYANLESEGPANYFLEQVKREAQEILDEVNAESHEQYDLRKNGLVIETTLSLELQLAAQRAFKEQLGRMQPKLEAQYRQASHKKALSALAEKRISDLGLEEEAGQMAMRELFSWDGFYTDSISVRDSLIHDLTLLHAGLMALDPRDGEVKAWIGGIDHRTQPYDQVFAQRQAASAFKPILYATALEQGAMPCQYLDNDPIVLSDFEDWAPNNYDGSFGGSYSLSASLAKSMNVPTVNLFFRQEFDSLQATWKRLGFSQDLEREPSTALGTGSASLYEMTQAYASFANGGQRVDPVVIRSIKTSEGKVLYRAPRQQEVQRVLDPGTAQLLTAMLQKAVNEGTGASLRGAYGLTMPLAGKTGTSQDYADAWFIGYSPNLVLATRVGARFPSIHFDRGGLGSGSALALPIVAKTLQSLERSASLRNRFTADFEELPEDYAYALQCEDYIDDSEVEKFFESVFDSRTTTFEKASRKAQRRARKKNGFFQRLFGKKGN